ncbi:MAG TPA: MtrB/PioB family outer membrane beta-barrel protein [Bryobacteraceae bacterium]|nr:MtrB/PioB family outer membrane beta-barrel protein [Bryobacteraceae bacterium]
MKFVCSLAFALPLAAQQAPAPAPSPAPSSESWLTGDLEIGNRWLFGPGGSFPTYRSIVNLGAGPKLIGTDISIHDPKRRYFDRLRIRAYNWGDDPYESLHVFADKQAVYEFNADFRRVAYFNNLPSFADPLLSRGIALNEQSFDTRRTLGSFTLDMLPTRMITPYVAYDRDSSSGSGVTVFQSNSDEFAVPSALRDSTDLYRGGVRFTGHRFHLTLEEGGTTFRTDQNTYTSTTAAPNPGNNINPVLGQTLGLAGLQQAYGIRGAGTFTKVILTVTPFSWLDVYGHFLYSEPHNDVNYQQYNNGSFFLPSQLLFYNSEQYLVTAAAKLPHTTANVGWEIRPINRVRIVQSWLTDRLHNAGSANQADSITATASSAFIANQLQSALATNFSQAETNIIFDLNRSIVLRGGYRYVWGDARDAVLPLEGLPTVNREKIRRQVGMGAVTWRPGQKFSLTGEVEGGSSGGVYFRTSLYNYTKVRGIAKYALLNSWHVSADYNILSNRNPVVDSSYKFLVHNETLAVSWNPSGKKYDAEASWSHCGYHSRISYLVPQLLAATDSVYTEYCHTISGFFNLSYHEAHLAAGGSAVLTSGSRPTNYYQPVAKVTVPIARNISVFAEWRYYGFGEPFYMYEAFRAHLLTTGLRFSR